MTQIKKLKAVIDEETKKNESVLSTSEKERGEALKEVGNTLHESVIVSNDEVCLVVSYLHLL